MSGRVRDSVSDIERRLRVLHIVHGLGRGGLENGVVNLLNGLPREFHQALCCLDQTGDLTARVAPGIQIQVLNRTRHDLGLPFRLARIIAAWRPDVIHSRNWNTWLDSVQAHWLAGRRGSLVWSFHGFADGHWFPRRRRLASRLLALATDRLSAVCRDAAQRFAELCNVPRSRFEVLYNGVDCARFAPAMDRDGLRRGLGLAGDELVVLTVASLVPVKGHVQLLEAAARVMASTDRKLRFLWLGDGPERPALERRIAELGLGDRVQLSGSSDLVPEFLAASDLFVLPSRLEGMSNAILEAMASGLPVVANAVGGNPELVEHGCSGLLGIAGDAESMADSIRRLVCDHDARADMGRAGRRRAEQIFSLDRMLDRYADFYRGAGPRLGVAAGLRIP